MTELVAELSAGLMSAKVGPSATFTVASTEPTWVATAVNVNSCDAPGAIAPSPQEVPLLLVLQPPGTAPRVKFEPRLKVMLPSFDAVAPRLMTATE